MIIAPSSPIRSAMQHAVVPRRLATGFAVAGLALACSSSGSGAVGDAILLEESRGEAAASGEEVALDDAAACELAFFCDDFESRALDVAPTGGGLSAVQNGGSVRVDAERAFRGEQSLKATTQPGDGYKSAMLTYFERGVLPNADNRVYGRMMFFLESAPTTSVHWTFIDGTGDVGDEGYSVIYRYGGQRPVAGGSELMANYETPDHYGNPDQGPATDCFQRGDGATVPVGRWSCAEWMFDGPSSEMRLWLDSAEVEALHVRGTGDGCGEQPDDYTWVAPDFNVLHVGWESYQPDDERSIWIDDVVLSTARIGCPTVR